ncbi:hypothetical protein GY45DRAFT_382985 [Cubamyces sp. BRFM 1775]|nr:hypothetical protein GY45DRAFT_382985 [Cubamyces sp. BRFM 1775]
MGMDALGYTSRQPRAMGRRDALESPADAWGCRTSVRMGGARCGLGLPGGGEARVVGRCVRDAEAGRTMAASQTPKEGRARRERKGEEEQERERGRGRGTARAENGASSGESSASEAPGEHRGQTIMSFQSARTVFRTRGRPGTLIWLWVCKCYYMRESTEELEVEHRRRGTQQ